MESTLIKLEKINLPRELLDKILFIQIFILIFVKKK